MRGDTDWHVMSLGVIQELNRGERAPQTLHCLEYSDVLLGNHVANLRFLGVFQYGDLHLGHTLGFSCSRGTHA
jgi:hypothetical protein